MQRFSFACIIVLLLAVFAGPLFAKGTTMTLYVATNGRDSWSGRLPVPNAGKTDGPFATIGHARDVLRALRADGRVPGACEVQVRQGSYQLSEPLCFTPADSGTADAPVSYRAYPGESPVISGGQRITGWRQGEINGHPCWIANLPEVATGQWSFTQLFVDGQRRPRTRLPKEGYFRFAGVPDPPVTTNPWRNGPLSATFHDADLQSWRNLSDVEIVTLQYWNDKHLYPTQVDQNTHQVTFLAHGASGIDETKQFSRYYVNNIFEALDTPGQWYLDRPTGTLYYLPRPGEQPATTTVVAPRLSTLLQFQGDAQQRVAYLRMEGLAFHYAEWTLPRTNPGDSQAANHTPGAIQFSGADHCALFRCDIAHVGQYAVEVAKDASHNRVIACTLQDLGAGGVKVNATTDHTEVADCTITHGGLVYHAAVGVLVMNSGFNRIHHNVIADLYYTGISCGWTWGYKPTATVDNRIEYNDIHDIGQGMLSDMGGIYTLGPQPGGIIRGNVIHDIAKYSYGGWGIYNDEGSSEILVEGNLTYRTGTSGYNMHYGRDVLVRNNIFALSREANIGRGRQEAHRSFVFTRNIVFWNEAHKMFDGYSNDATWPHIAFANNIYWNAAAPKEVDFAGMSLPTWQALGNDKDSRIADPLFVNPATGDFRLRADSPAHQMGFVPLDVQQAGPRHRQAARLDDWFSDAEQPKPILDAHLELVDADAFKTQTRGTVRLVARNCGTAPATGAFKLAPEVPGSLRIDGATDVSFSLRPGEEFQREFPVEMIGDMEEASLVATPSGDAIIPICVYIPNALYRQWGIARHAAVASPEDLSVALANVPGRAWRWNKQAIADVKIALAGDELAVQATVYDSNIRRQPERPWEASALELFISPVKEQEITQLIFAPPTKTEPSAVWCHRTGKAIPTIPMRYTIQPVTGGYQLLLLCPLRELGLAADAREFLLEMTADLTPTNTGSHQSLKLFGSRNPFSSNERYGHIVVLND